MPMPSEAPSRGRRERPRCLLRQGRYRLAEKAFSVTLARLHGPLETAGRQMPLPASAALQKRAPHVLIVLIRGRHSYALFVRRLPYMRRKGTPRAKQGREHVLAVKTDNRQAVDRNNIHMAQCVLKAVKAFVSPLGPSLRHRRPRGSFSLSGNGYGASRTGAGDPEKPSGSRQDRASQTGVIQTIASAETSL